MAKLQIFVFAIYLASILICNASKTKQPKVETIYESADASVTDFVKALEGMETGSKQSVKKIKPDSNLGKLTEHFLSHMMKKMGKDGLDTDAPSIEIIRMDEMPDDDFMKNLAAGKQSKSKPKSNKRVERVADKPENKHEKSKPKPKSKPEAESEDDSQEQFIKQLENLRSGSNQPNAVELKMDSPMGKKAKQFIDKMLGEKTGKGGDQTIVIEVSESEEEEEAPKKQSKPKPKSNTGSDSTKKPKQAAEPHKPKHEKPKQQKQEGPKIKTIDFDEKDLENMNDEEFMNALEKMRSDVDTVALKLSPEMGKRAQKLIADMLKKQNN